MIVGNKKQKGWYLVFLAPGVLLFLFLVMVPIGESVIQSFYTWNGISISPMKFVGWDNYRALAKDQSFWNSLQNVGWFLIGGFVVLMPLSFILAIIINKSFRLKKFFKATYFLPVVLPTAAVGLMWVYMLFPESGVVPLFLKFFHISSPNFLGDPKWTAKSIVLVNEWIYAGLNMLIFSAGLVSIPESLYESARIDGASGWEQIKYITLPLMNAYFRIFSVLCVTGCIMEFNLVFVMTGGGPSHASEMPATLLYNEAFKYRNFGVGNAIGVFLLVSGVTLSLLTNKLLSRKED
ncbi:sugar ABC transporter permease [uncultured Sphaerochaeta sp.]|uniref:carbohydrate ABC transporter permease n=1 Tax=uncultured Sphaerochaeta sp. TaxID=886478 RepID=UPI002A0A3165|nr:sugar ABC transporter permease [uncultured Sphaerochaeta sp.]